MIKAIIIEDEANALELMSHILSQLPLEVKVTARLRSVKEAIHYFMNEPEGDIIFSDIQLSDGLSFEIFQHLNLNIPVVFTTCFDRFFLSALENNGIDYCHHWYRDDHRRYQTLLSFDVYLSFIKYL